MKSAAISTLLTWGLVLSIVPAWLYLKCDLENLRDLRGMLRTVVRAIFTMGHSRTARCCRDATDLEFFGRRHLARILGPHLVFLRSGRTKHRRVHGQLDFLWLVI